MRTKVLNILYSNTTSAVCTAYHLKKVISIALLCLMVNYCHGQLSLTDSLRTALENSSSHNIQLELMDQLVNEWIGLNLDSATYYAYQSIELQRSDLDSRQKAKAHFNLGLVLYETDERESALQQFTISNDMSRDLGLIEIQSRSLMRIANYHRYVTNDSTRTVNALLKSAKLSVAANFEWGAARSYAKLASFYTGYDDIQLCEDYLKKSARYYANVDKGLLTTAHYYNEVGSKIWDTNPLKAMDLFYAAKEYANTPNVMLSLARAHSYIDDQPTAISYLEEAIPFFEETEKRRRKLGVAISLLADAQLKLGNHAEAMISANRGLEILMKLGRTDQVAIPSLYRTKAIIAEYRGNEKEAVRYYSKSISEAKRVKTAFERVKSLLALGKFYISTDHDTAEDHCDQAMRDAIRRKYTSLEMEACDCLYQIHKANGAYLEALDLHERKKLLSDSLSTINVKHAIDINSKLSQKDKQLYEQQLQKELKEKEVKTQYKLIAVLLFSTLLGATLIGFLMRNRHRINKQNEEISMKTKELVLANQNLEQTNLELERFAHIASHDLKSPVKNIIGLTDLLKSKIGNREYSNTDELMDLIATSGRKLNRLIEDVLEFSVLSSPLKAQKEVIVLEELIDQISQESQYASDKYKISFEDSQLPQLMWYNSKMFLLFKNLIENGLKYNQSDHPQVRIHYSQKDGQHMLHFTDNGIGIKKEYFDKIFVMFGRLHNHAEYEGTGIGLANCKKIVQEFDGDISVSSELGIGSIFTIRLPKKIVHSYNNPTESQSLHPALV